MASADLPGSRPSGLEFTINGRFSLGAGHTHFNFRTQSGVQAQFLLFESVELVSAEFNISMSPLDTGFVYAGFVEQDPANDPAALTLANVRSALDAASIRSYSYLSRDDPLRVACSLPSNHNFGSELRTQVIGNPLPHFTCLVVEVPDGSPAVVGQCLWSIHFVGRGKSSTSTR